MKIRVVPEIWGKYCDVLNDFCKKNQLSNHQMILLICNSFCLACVAYEIEEEDFKTYIDEMTKAYDQNKTK